MPGNITINNAPTALASSPAQGKDTTMLVKSPASRLRQKMGQFTIVANLPGQAVPNHHDHGYGPLARFDESTLEPGAYIPMQEHRNDEIRI